MTNGQKLALCGFVSLFVAGSLLWRPIALLGIPAGVVGVLAGLALYRAYGEDEADDGSRKQILGATVAGVAALILAISVGANVLAESGLLARAKSAPATDSASHAAATYSSEPTGSAAASARTRIERAAEWCRGMYEAYDPDGSGFRECMKRRTPASDYAVVAGDASLSRNARRADAMAKSVRYCEQFAHNRMLHGDCLKAEQELRGW